MGTVSIKIGLLRRDHEYFGGRTLIPSEVFYIEQMRSARIGYLVPEVVTGLGSVGGGMAFVQANGNVPAGAKPGVDFYYDVNNPQRVRYFGTCNSADYLAALESTDAHNYVALAVFEGSGYTLQG